MEINFKKKESSQPIFGVDSSRSYFSLRLLLFACKYIWLASERVCEEIDRAQKRRRNQQRTRKSITPN